MTASNRPGLIKGRIYRFRAQLVDCKCGRLEYRLPPMLGTKCQSTSGSIFEDCDKTDLIMFSKKK